MNSDADKSAEPPVPRTRTPARAFVAAIVFVFVWLSMIQFPATPVSDEMHASFGGGLALTVAKSMSPGQEYIFTYGPLGFFTSNVSVDWLAPARWCWEIVIKSSLSVCILILLIGSFPCSSRKHGYLMVLPCVYAIAALLSAPPVASLVFDLPYYLGLFAAAILLLSDRDHVKSGVWSTFLGALLGAIALTKFTFLILVAAILLIVFAQKVIGKQIKSGLSMGLSAICVFSFGWYLYGGTVAGLANYVSYGLALSSGHSRAMALTGPLSELIVALLIGFLFFIWATWHMIQSRFEIASVARSLVLAIFVFLLWKYSFARHDMHSLSFFAFAVLGSMLALSGRSANMLWDNRWFRFVPVTLAILGISGIALAYSLQTAPNMPGQPRGPMYYVQNLRGLAGLDTVGEEKKELDLHVLDSYIQESPVDLFHYQQGVVILNGWDWHPRPVFQSYVAYTPELAAANAQFYRGENRPDFVVIRWGAIDGRYPSLPDGAAMREVLRSYDPIAVERGYLLLAAKPVRKVKASATNTGKIQNASWIDVPDSGDDLVYLSFSLEPSLPGRLRSFLLRSSYVYIDVQLEDGAEYRRFRLPPGMAETGFLLSPFIGSQDDLEKMFAAKDSQKVQRFRIAAETPGDYRWTAQYILEWEARQWQPLPEGWIYADTLGVRATAIDSGIGAGGVAKTTSPGGESVLLVHAPGRVVLEMRGGTLRGRCGILPADGAGDGAVFRMSVERTGALEVLWEEPILPADPERSFSVNVPVGAERVILETLVGESGDGSWDWTYWRDLSVVEEPLY